MPTIFRSGPYRVYFFSNEAYEPPHVHIDRDDQSAKFWLRPVRLAINRGFGATELKALHRLVTEHETLCWKKWHDYFAAS